MSEREAVAAAAESRRVMIDGRLLPVHSTVPTGTGRAVVLLDARGNFVLCDEAELVPIAPDLHYLRGRAEAPASPPNTVVAQ